MASARETDDFAAVLPEANYLMDSGESFFFVGGGGLVGPYSLTRVQWATMLLKYWVQWFFFAEHPVLISNGIFFFSYNLMILYPF